MDLESIDFGFLRAQFTSMKYIIKYYEHVNFTGNYLYHYTNLDGLIGILTNKGFWLSEARFLNDKEELINGKNISIRLIDYLINKERYSCFNEILSQTKYLLENKSFDNYYIASFTTKPDDLEQWRAYSGNGTGVCIGFNVKKETSFPHFNLGGAWSLKKIIYNDDIKLKILHYIIYKYFIEYKKDLRQNTKYIETYEYANEYANNLFHSLVYNFINFKHYSFSQEKEIRLVYDMNNPLNFFHKKHYRINNNKIIPYVCTYETKLKKNEEPLINDQLPIFEIIVGPTIQQEITMESIKYLVKDLGYDENIVKKSKIPYRG